MTLNPIAQHPKLGRLTKPVIYSLVLSVVLGAFLGAYQLIDSWQEDNRSWDEVVGNFKRCDLGTALYELGDRENGVQHESSTIPYLPSNHVKSYIDLIKRSATDPSSDLDTIWINYSKQGSLGSTKQSEHDVNLLSVCKNLLESGDKSVGLEVGRYYLASKKFQAVQWLLDAGDKGVADAYTLLGHGYKAGLVNGLKNERLALDYYLKAVKSGSTKAKLYVAEIVRSVDSKMASFYWLAAAGEGSQTAAYKLLKSPYIVDPRKKYFWSLAFEYLTSENRKKPLTFDVTNLEDHPTEYMYDGLPVNFQPNNLPITQDQYLPPPSETYVAYNSLDAEESLKRYESILPPADRMVVQEIFQRWVKNRDSNDADAVAIKKIDL